MEELDSALGLALQEAETLRKKPGLEFGNFVHNRVYELMAKSQHAKFIVFEQSVDELGNARPLFVGGTKRPDIMILVDDDAIAKTSESLKGKIHGVVDLKTGGAVVKPSWKTALAGRLGIEEARILQGKAGESMLGLYRKGGWASKAASGGLMASRITKGALKRYAPKVITGLSIVFVAQNVKAKGVAPGIANTALDSTPVLNWAKAATESLDGDWIPNKGEESSLPMIFHSYGDNMAAAGEAGFGP